MVCSSSTSTRRRTVRVASASAEVRKSASRLTCSSSQARRCTSSLMTTSKSCPNRAARSTTNQSRAPTRRRATGHRSLPRAAAPTRLNRSRGSGAAARADSSLATRPPRHSALVGASRDPGVASASSSRGFCSPGSQPATSHFHAFGLLACSRASAKVRADCAHRTDSSATAAISAAPSAYAATVFLVYQMGSYIDGMGPSWPMSL
jgi:hypothetical protein